MKRKIFYVFLCVVMVTAVIIGCSKEKEKNIVTDEKKEESVNKTDNKKNDHIIGISLGTLEGPYYTAMAEENIKYAEENYPEFLCITEDGKNDAQTQVKDVEKLMEKGIDLLLISPLSSDALTPICEKAMKQGIPVVTMGQNVNGDMTCYVGADNKAIGTESAVKLGDALGGNGKIVEIQGPEGTVETIDRHAGFTEQLETSYPDMEIVATKNCDNTKENAKSFIDETLQQFGPGEIGAIYCHNDEMALGALEALRAAERDAEGILVTGIGGTEAAFSEIEDGNMFFTISYPYCAPEGIQAAYKILKDEGVDERWVLDTTAVDRDNISDWIGKGL
jgi:ribose transport system substrate-binding protein